MKYELSMCLAAIRPHFWKQVYDTALTSCSRYPFELIIISPYDLPDELKGYDNIKLIKEHGSPCRASQIGAVHAEGKLLAFPCDDGIFLPDAVNQSIDLYNSTAGPKDGIVWRYKEGAGMNAPSFPEEYWYARRHIPVHSLNLEHHWKIAPQPMLSVEYYKALGGVDCLTFECMAFATHDLCYRMQRDGGTFHISPLEVMDADNYGDHGVDHTPVYVAQTTSDQPKFFGMYSNPDVRNRIHIDFDNWKSSPEKWTRRWQ